jgi:hypothetical protein
VSDLLSTLPERAMLALKVTITRFVNDEPQPGVVECELVDAHGRRWRFVEKTAVVSPDDIDATSVYPRHGVIAGEVLARRRDATGREIIRIDTGHPWGVESVDGTTQFEVRPEALVEL